ncbi:MAG TPA: saccharopine dehydrogenase C-terminal domain-containing protein [Pseudonocardiaceae bacterium]
MAGTVHWIGTGLSTGGGLRLLAERAPRLVMWGRTVARAEDCLERVGLAGRVECRALSAAATPVAAVAAAVEAGDVVVSMLPATEHTAMARLCVERGAHFACSSYTSPELAALADEARTAGVVLLTEAGLDPGIDHLFADVLVHEALAAVGDGPAEVEFTSYCGGIPAVPNDFRYRFSWAPRGVLTALCSPARYVAGGEPTTVERPWEATRPHVLGAETFEVYPNRDSVPFIEQYRFPAGWRVGTFVRGTLRLDGWRQAWAGVFDVLRTGDDERITALAAELAARYPTTPADLDRVVLAVVLSVTPPGGDGYRGEYLLDLTGTETDSAMSRCVSLPLAVAVLDVLSGALPAGLGRAAPDVATARRWLDTLAGHGVPFTHASGTA